jgi:uncharacterized protein (TIGR02246 family)
MSHTDVTAASSSADAVSRVADELAIRNVIASMAIGADTGGIDDYVNLFTEDAEWLMPGGERRGRADIRAGVVERRRDGVTGPGTNTRHMVGSIDVHVDGSDTATARSYYVFIRDTKGTPTIATLGFYNDTFTRTADGWKIARRDITPG